jgi:sugar lactone lactonase YvrE
MSAVLAPLPRGASVLGWLGLALAGACTPSSDRLAVEAAASLPVWAWDSTFVFPADGSLLRPEDGVQLPDGRLIVADQAHGLRLIELDGSHRPFGTMLTAGYRHRPPAHAGGANGVSLEPSGRHVLVADIFDGAIYRVELATGAAERVYRNRYGINTAVRDSRGAIWFTQSAHNTPEAGEARIWAAVDIPAPEGALYRLAPRNGGHGADADLMVDSLYFANGIAIDEARGLLYLAETVGGRVWRYRVDLDAGRLSDPEVLVDGIGPDNLELDDQGRLWIAMPLGNGVMVVEPATGERRIVFQSLTPAQQDVLAEFIRRGEAGLSRMELFTPDSWAPLPGPLTGIILGRDDQPVYLTGLGGALVRLPR